MWKRFLCAVLGHRIVRLEGCNNPLISFSTPESGLEMRVDICYRCGVLFTNLRRVGFGEVEAVHLISQKEESNDGTV
jgi:hypothetical protein